MLPVAADTASTSDAPSSLDAPVSQREGPADSTSAANPRDLGAAELVHHSDRGVQYASRDYTDLLLQHGIQISMSRTANPWDNAMAEAFLKTLKYEEVYRQEYRDLLEARASIQCFLEKLYNEMRL